MGAQGTTTLNFGAFPGNPYASADVIGQSGLTASSLIEAWVMPVLTADHTADEHIMEGLNVRAVFKVNGEFTIHGSVADWPLLRQRNYQAGAGLRSVSGGGAVATGGGGTTGITETQTLYGLWTIGWVWN